MTSPLPQIEILDLRHFNARQLRPILEQESILWRERLRWDYASSAELLLQYLEIQILPGFVALMRGRIVGYCFCVYEGTKAVIGDIFVLPDTPSRIAVSHTLARHLMEVLQASPDIDRIEAQLLLFDTGVLAQPFRNAGFIVYPRLFLECELGPHAGAPTLLSPALPEAFELCAWQPGFYQPAAELIHTAYQGHLDSQINDQYRSLAGSLRFLHNIVRFPGCGVFDPRASWALRERRTNTIIGILLCSRVADGIAHVTQICVAPSVRGQSMGKLLLLHCMEHLSARGFSAITLTVSEANHPAVRLYTEAGFTKRLRFEALVLEKQPQPQRIRVPYAESADLLNLPLENSPKTSGGLFAFARKKPTPPRT